MTDSGKKARSHYGQRFTLLPAQEARTRIWASFVEPEAARMAA